jgi:hemolysin D
MKKIQNYGVLQPESFSQQIRILLVDDQSFARRFVTRSLEADPNLKIVGTAQNGKEAIAKVEAINPDMVLIDLEMPEMDGIAATEIIAQRFPNCKVLILTSHETGDYLQKALRAGAKGYLIKGSPAIELTNAIHSVYRGYTQLSPGLLERVLTPGAEILPDIQPVEASPSLPESEWADSTREAVNTLPRVSLRVLFYVILIMLAGLIPWATFAKVDEIGSATGKLEPKGRVIELGSPVEGKVVNINIKEGQQVQANQSIIELDDKLVQAELQQQEQKLIGQENQLNQLELLKKQQSLSLITQQQQNKAQLYEKEALIEQAKNAIAASQSAHQTAKIRYRAAQAKVPRYRNAHNQGALSIDVLAEAEQQAEEYKENIRQTGSETDQARSRLAEQKRGLASLVQTNNLAFLKTQEEYKNTEGQIATLQGEIGQTKSLIRGLEYQIGQRVLNAPISGIVFQLPVKQPGAVVQPGQMVAQIAPKNSPLVLRGRMSSRESGFLKKGLPVKVKFDAYPYQDYGIVPGRLTWVSPNSRAPEGNSQDSQSSQGASQPMSPEDFYEVEVALERNYVQNQDRIVTLTPGQTATAEVVIRQRRLADILLVPFKSLKKGGMQL